MAHVGIIGGGITGLFSAYYLKRAGHEVWVFDRGRFTEGCSYGNAGMIVPSHIVPLAAPSVVRKGLKWLLQHKSPFAIKLAWDAGLLQWLYLFYRHATTENVRWAVPHLAALSLHSRQLYQDLDAAGEVDLGFRASGILMLCQSAATEAEERHVADLANAYGIEARLLSAKALSEMDPSVTYSVRSAIYYPGDAILDPALTMQSLQAYLVQRGVHFCPGQEVHALRAEQGAVKALLTTDGEHAFDHYVLCGGVWSDNLLRRLGMRLPLAGGKGYSFVLPNTFSLQLPALLLDHRVSVTPYGAQVRFGGTMELGRCRTSIDYAKVQGIYEAISVYYPAWQSAPPAVEAVWHGFRPCSPDGLPYIGTASGLRNLHIAAGHGMLGVSLAPASGEAIARIITTGEQPPAAFSPGRFAVHTR